MLDDGAMDHAWTVGRLRDALANLDPNTPLHLTLDTDARDFSVVGLDVDPLTGAIWLELEEA